MSVAHRARPRLVGAGGSPRRGASRSVRLCATLCAGLVAAPVPVVHAAPARDPATKTELDEAFEAHARGRARYETADYAGAIEDFTIAYWLLPRTPENVARRQTVLRELILAHINAHAVDERIEHLRTAKILLTRYLAALEEGQEAERHEGEALVRDVDELLAKIEAERAAQAASKAKADAPVAAIPEGPQPEASSVDLEIRHGRNLVIAGGVLIGLSVVAGAVVAVGVYQLQDARYKRDVYGSMMPDAPNQYDRLADAQVDRWTPVTVYAALATGAFATLGGVLLVHGRRLLQAHNVSLVSLVAPDGRGPGLALRLSM
ncbi:MAG: hypothetical protein KC636_38820 [Myxococcales bacterium]|nr:hypothetical protein [Myxococcales bacterium]